MTRKISFVACVLLFLAGCRKDIGPIPEEQEPIFQALPDASPKGVYLLNEANMNSNKASLDYVDYTRGIYRRNIYNQANPSVTKGLGDVGNDLLAYGSKLYIVLNTSNKVEVVDLRTAKKLGQINLTNCRYLCAYGGNVYVSAYYAKVNDAGAQNGIVAELDTGSLKIVRQTEVGRQPEELAIVNNRLYVANSGGYSPPDYENSISVVDLNSFSEVKKIPVAINLHRLKADEQGDLYVSSRGDYYTKPSGLYVIDTRTETIKKRFNFATSDLAISGGKAYIYSTAWNAITQKNLISYTTVDTREDEVLPEKFIRDGTDENIKVPYGIEVNPQNGDILITDAGDYVSPGMLYCYSVTGTLKWKVKTGDIPAHFAFVY